MTKKQQYEIQIYYMQNHKMNARFPLFNRELIMSPNDNSEKIFNTEQSY